MILQAPASSGTGHEIGTPSTAWRARSDAWEFLEYAFKEHAAASRRPTSTNISEQIKRTLRLLESIEPYWAFPGLPALNELTAQFHDGNHRKALELVEALNDEFHRLRKRPETPTAEFHQSEPSDAEGTPEREGSPLKPRFELLVIGDPTTEDTDELRAGLLNQRRHADSFTYDINVVPSYEDALVALLINPDIQACVIRPGFAIRSTRRPGRDLQKYLENRLGGTVLDQLQPIKRILHLAEAIADIRPEVDIFLIAGVAMESLASSLTHRFRRIFRREDHLDLHLSILAGCADRYETPFFTALQNHSRRPGIVFHALPISRGGSVVDSPWIGDMADFYGRNLLMAETSATSGDLDSLLDPHGSIKRAQNLAARAFGAQRTYFVTNGTSTANKIVHQSIVAPGDIVLVDRNCHKSHHYGLMLSGARVCYLDAYPLNDHSFYGAVTLESIKGRLLAYRRSGRLHKVKMIALTNCTFDGIVYDVERVMEECLAIKPDLVFLWDEAWFAFAGFHPVYRKRTAMASARNLEQSFKETSYRQRFEEQSASLGTIAGREEIDDEAWIRTRLVPDPRVARLRVYATQSTHKTLTSLRQGSMIHVFDQDFGALNQEAFREAFMTHTSTSPNYQILASLDIGRRQVEFEGFALVQRQTDLALSIAQAVSRHPMLKKYFRILTSTELVPQAHRETKWRMPAHEGIAAWDEAWEKDEFVVDPSRLTLDIGLTGVDGDTFKHDYLMNEYGIQVNKTSRNSVLFMTNIGTGRSAVAYLIEVLVKLAERFERDGDALGPRERTARQERVSSLTSSPPPLPDFSRFAAPFRDEGGDPDGDLRAAYFLTYQPGSTDYLSSSDIRKRLEAEEEVVSAGFITPYPPGFPVLVPGQLFTPETLEFMDALDTREIHGYHQDLGYRVLT